MSKFKILFFLILLFSSIPSFAGIIRDDVPIEKYLALAQEPQFDCVGQAFFNEKPVGSCVLISGKYVLSALHCFLDMDDQIYMERVKDDKGDTILVPKQKDLKIRDINDLTFEFKGMKYKGSRLFINPACSDTFNVNHDIDLTGDLIIIELEKNVPDINPAVLNHSFDEIDSDVFGVGFGASCKATDYNNLKSLNQKIAGENTVDSIGGKIYNGKPTLMICDFDIPGGYLDCNKMGSPFPTDMEYLSAGGDSGGGLFRKVDGKWILIGIAYDCGYDFQNLVKNGFYGSTMDWTRVSVFIDWLKHYTEKQ
jgi:hypothetical protein